MFPHLDPQQIEVIKILSAYAIGLISGAIGVYFLVFTHEQLHPELYEVRPEMDVDEQLDDIDIALKNNVYHLP